MNINDYLITANSTILDALKKIEINHSGFIFVNDISGKVLGIATDGDIRRSLIKNNKTSNSILDCCNFNYVKATKDTPKEVLLKNLDNNIRVIKILDENNNLIKIISKDNIPEVI